MGKQPLLSDVWTSKDGVNWELITERAEWRPRCYHSAVSFKGKIWILGGFIYEPPTNVLNDIWVSEDGFSWKLVTDDAPWEAREHMGCVVFKDKIFLLGGVTYGPPFSCFSDVWTSEDGYSWKMIGKAPWGPRRGFGCVIFNDKIWVLGGFDSSGKLYNDVWSSSNGVSWWCVTKKAPWKPRGTYRCLVFDDKIWVLGGNIKPKRPGVVGANDVWSTEDGTNWKLETKSAPWSGRAGCIAFAQTMGERQRLWIMGGFTYTPKKVFFNDAWYFETEQ